MKISEVSRGLHCLNEVCNCRDVTFVNSLNSRKLPGRFSLPKQPWNEAIPVRNPPTVRKPPTVWNPLLCGTPLLSGTPYCPEPPTVWIPDSRGFPDWNPLLSGTPYCLEPPSVRNPLLSGTPYCPEIPYCPEPPTVWNPLLSGTPSTVWNPLYCLEPPTVQKPPTVWNPLPNLTLNSSSIVTPAHLLRRDVLYPRSKGQTRVYPAAIAMSEWWQS